MGYAHYPGEEGSLGRWSTLPKITPSLRVAETGYLSLKRIVLFPRHTICVCVISLNINLSSYPPNTYWSESTVCRHWSWMEHRVLGSWSWIKNQLWGIPKVENSHLDNEEPIGKLSWVPLEISESCVQFPGGPGQGVLGTLGFHIIENVPSGCVSQREICSPGGFQIYFNMGVFLHGF